MDAAITGFVGALVGAGASLFGLMIQQHYQTKRERVKVASELALVEYQRDLELAKADGGGMVAPLAGYIIFNVRLLEELSKGPITPEQVRALSEEKKKVLAAFPGAPQT
jgi:hypothetical protein